MEDVILVNDHDEVLGSMEKLEAHRTGVLHRAFSIFLWDDRGRLLLQRRALGKYHSAGLWTNTCCSHPRPGEGAAAAAHRRLQEEMGIVCELEHRFSFIYKARLDNGLIEHEFDHVFFGRSAATPAPDPMEVCDWRYVDIATLDEEMRSAPERFTVWLMECWAQIRASLATP